MSFNTLLLSFSLLFAGNATTTVPSNTVTISAEKPVFSTTLSGQQAGTISQKELAELKPDVVIYADKSPAQGYQVQSFVVIVVSKNAKDGTSVYHQKGAKVDESTLTVLHGLKVGDKFIVDQVKATSSAEGERFVAPKVYEVTE